MRKSEVLALFAVALLLCAGVVFSAGPASAAQKDKVGFVDLQRTLNESEAGKKAKKELEGIIREKQGAIDEKIKARGEAQEDLEKKMLALSETAKRKKSDELMKMQKEIERLIADAEEEVQKTQRDREIAILKDLESIIMDIAKKGGFSIILPSDVILFGDKGTEITDNVIKMFNEKSAGKTSPDQKKEK